jgi:AcrR family transcriptional regulator
MTTSLPAAGPGLRERKKARTRAAIRDHAMRLFEDQGYAATTVDQIAAAADVSPSTFFRYFPTKEDVVLTDDYDPLLVAALHRQPPELPPVTAIRYAMREVFGSLSDEDWAQEERRQRLFQAVPELRARAFQQLDATLRLLAGALADRAGLPPDDFSARVLAGAVIGAIMAAMPHGLNAAMDRGDLALVERAADLLEAGLPLGPAGTG